MIIPTQITDFNRSDAELERFALFCLIVAGKNSDIAANKVNQMMGKMECPFALLREADRMGRLEEFLRCAKTGQYNRYTKAIRQLIQLDVRTCTLAQLMDVYGIGPKTARFFLLHSRPHQTFVVLDVHILKWMAQKGIEVPINTPTSINAYNTLEAIAINLMLTEFGMVNAETDLAIWKKASGRE